jgi:hypothetical protein
MVAGVPPLVAPTVRPATSSSTAKASIEIDACRAARSGALGDDANLE